MKKSNIYTKYRKSEVKAGLILSLPFFILFLLFTVVPVLGSVVMSFTNFNMMSLPKFVGAENYTRLFLQDSIFIKAVGNTFILALILGPGGYALSFIFAWLLNEVGPKIRTIFTFCFYAPSISGNILVIWQLVFSGDSQGYLNSTSFLVFIAGLQGVDRSYYEAGAIDGLRNRWQELWYITLPLMKPQLLFSAVMSITGSFGVGGLITSLCGYPTVNYTAHTIMNHLSDYAGARFEVGYASAIATVLFAMMYFCNIVIQKLLSKVGT